MVYVSVKGGTHAGWRTVQEKRVPWTCSAGHDNPAYMTRCRECKEPS